MTIQDTDDQQQQQVYTTLECLFDSHPTHAKSTIPTEFGFHTDGFSPIYTKNVKWSPDGLVLLSNSDDNTLRLFEMTPSLLNNLIDDDDDTNWKSCLRMKESGPVYDFDWYPRMNSQDPSTCFFISASCSQPVHMWDAFTGKVRHSFGCLDTNSEELVTPISTSFNTSGDKIFCGLNRSIKVFDTEHPGYSSSEIICCEKIERKYYGMTSLISCFAFPRDTTCSVFAAGCYNNGVGLFDQRQQEMLQLLEGHTQGVTFMKYSLCGNFLFTGVRKSGELLCWDLRNIHEPLLSFQMNRTVSSNVKISFDIDHTGRHLVTGNDRGKFSVFDLTTAALVNSFETGKRDCINSAVLHPYLPYIATSSGERKYVTRRSAEPTSDDDEQDEMIEHATVSLWRLNHNYQTFPVI